MCVCCHTEGLWGTISGQGVVLQQPIVPGAQLVENLSLNLQVENLTLFYI